ncbi:hypothetical protein [Burkholderia pseudomallei]|uniref:hypothetical protein n=1 Tax=Burkholderia pseudomallei TaxID=28450 RepID=UPI00100B68A8|nr:hypothetical protein [Burkholderia pseudomallei]
MSRFEQSIEQNMGRATMARVQWKAKFKTDIRGKFSTQRADGNDFQLPRFIHPTRRPPRRTTPLQARTATLVTHIPRSSRPNEFDAFIFGVERHLKVRRNRERYEMNVELTDEEHEAVQPERLELFEKAQSGLLEEIDKLPKTASEHLERFLRLVDLQTRVVQSFVCESRGGFALDAPSCTAILTQLEGLRQTMCQAKAKFDREARRSEITCIARKYAPSNLSISVART